MAQENVHTHTQKKVSLRPLGEAILPLSYFKKESRSWFSSPGGFLMLVLFGMIGFVHLLFVWYFIDYFQGSRADYAKSPYVLLSRFQGQMAILLFSIEFILATRLRTIEKLFGGFDRVYKMHSLVGRIGFLMAIFHFVALLVNAGSYWVDMVLPGKTWAMLYGQLSLGLFFILVVLSVGIKIPYHIWLWTHKFFGVAFLLAGFHVWLAQPGYAKFDPYRTIFTVVWFLGMISYVYKLILYKYIAPRHKATVTRVEARHDIVDLYLHIEDNKFYSRPGDFVFIGLNTTSRKLPKEQHPFSISGLYEGNIIRLSIKDLGDFTHNVSQLQPGDTATIYGPYGKFDDKLYSKKNDMIWIGGGIGIAPFTYMAQYFGSLPSSGTAGKRKAILFHSIKEDAEALYTEEFQKAQEIDPDFSYKIWNTTNEGFLTAQDLAEAVGGIEELKKRMVFMCGPLPMMHAISKQLLELGMSPRQIIFEEFAFG
jgi:predicted ferric reductase